VLVQLIFSGLHVTAKSLLRQLHPLALAGARVGVAAPLLLLIASLAHRRLPGLRDQLRRHDLAPEEWLVVIKEAHPGYISWERYVSNRDKLRQSFISPSRIFLPNSMPRPPFGGRTQETLHYPCVAPRQTCGGSCVDLASNPNQCGSCGKVCPSPQVCSKGSCAASCDSGLTSCGRAVDGLPVRPASAAFASDAVAVPCARPRFVVA